MKKLPLISLAAASAIALAATSVSANAGSLDGYAISKPLSATLVLAGPGPKPPPKIDNGPPGPKPPPK
jgi:hypothetical protein